MQLSHPPTYTLLVLEQRKQKQEIKYTNYIIFRGIHDCIYRMQQGFEPLGYP